ncbi:MAG: hypothetical protein KC488_15930, partial [Candidatus Cloacimonetes bacterium]|nr:hypothetical protein [Candidatus Cloacimonadota bacterium]
SPGATLGLWSRWEVAANSYELDVYLNHVPATAQEPIRLVDLTLQWDPALLAAVGAPDPGLLFDGLSEVFYAHYDGVDGRTFTGTLLGQQPGVTPTGPVLILSQTFHALDLLGGPASITIANPVLRGEMNQSIPCDNASPVTLTVDTTPPSGYLYELEAISPPGNDTYTWLPTISQSLSGGDGSLHSLVNSEDPALPPNPSPLWTAPPLPGSFVLSAGNGLKTVYLDLRDQYGNAVTLSDQLTLDDQPPLPVGALTASPRHQGVQLDWGLPGDLDFSHVEIWRQGWFDSGISAYPEYDDIAPMDSWPADRDEAISKGFTLVYSGTGTSLLDSVVPRDVYRYVAIAVDLALIPAPIGPDSRARATNYFLGDFATPYSGTVHVADLVRLSNTYSTADGDFLYYNQADIGPSDDNGPLGIPMTDNMIDFEDLMLFAMNYSFSGPPLSAASGADLELADTQAPATLEWRAEGNQWSLWLSGNGILGARLVLENGLSISESDTEPWPLLVRPSAAGQELALVSLDGGDLSGRLLSLAVSQPPSILSIELRDRANTRVTPT